MTTDEAIFLVAVATRGPGVSIPDLIRTAVKPGREVQARSYLMRWAAVGWWEHGHELEQGFLTPIGCEVARHAARQPSVLPQSASAG